ncbi:hypothetical protein J2W59_002368 [Pseudomonas fluorescens]|nr:hypothetical protein [Pseudomonas fluorescens]
MEITFVVDRQQLLDSISLAPSCGDDPDYNVAFRTAD